MRTQHTADIVPRRPVLFLDDWPQPPRSAGEHDFESPGLTDLKKWRLQMLLAANPWGIPSLAFGKAYEKMFGKRLDIKDHGFEHLSDMVYKLREVFTIQEPDEMTALMFPEFPQDRILHDARLRHSFNNLHDIVSYSTADPETLVSYARLNRDDDFPQDVVLAGEQYADIILPMTPVNIEKTRGVYQALMIGAANPDHFYLNIKSEAFDRVSGLSAEVAAYFKGCQQPIEMFSVPEEFIYPGFPCLVYVKEQQSWERCAILCRTSRGNKVRVDVVDFGGVRIVNQIYLYLMPRKFFDIPRQAVLVSLIGLKPADGTEDWGNHVGARMRCFSNVRYWLDCLLVDPRKSLKDFSDDMSISGHSSICDDKSRSGTPPGKVHQSNNSSSLRKKKKSLRSPQFEVIICDRNDDEMDIYLDEIIAMETYASYDENRIDDITKLKTRFQRALKDLPRPENPLKSCG